MEDSPEGSNAPEHDLYIVEISGGDHVRYAVCEQIMTVEPGQNAMDVPWSELTSLFNGHTLRAVPMPRRRGGLGQQGGSASGASPAVSTKVEVKLKIGASD